MTEEELALYKVITLCGSTRFYKQFDEISLALTLKGFLVFSIGSHRIDDSKIVKICELKGMLDMAHREKINMSSSIFVIDVDGYIGNSTRSEIDYAKSKLKNIYYLSKGDLGKIGDYL